MNTRLRQNLIITAFSVVFSLILAEITLRFVLPPPITWQFPQEQYTFDSIINHTLEPNQHSFTHDKNVYTNSNGQRISKNELNSTQKPQYTILAVGDSQTFGNGLSIDSTWPKQLETALSKDRSVKVINGGIPATDTWQHEILIERLSHLYHPQEVILAIYVNDITDKFIPQKKILETNDLQHRIIYKMKQSSLLLTSQLALNAISNVFKSKSSKTHEQRILLGENSLRNKKGWLQVEKSLKNISMLAQANNFKFSAVILPRRDQASGIIKNKTYNQRLAIILNGLKIKHVDMLPILSDAYKTHGEKLFISWDGHNSALANKYIATAATKLITQK